MHFSVEYTPKSEKVRAAWGVWGHVSKKVVFGLAGGGGGGGEIRNAIFQRQSSELKMGKNLVFSNLCCLFFNLRLFQINLQI